MFDQYNLLYKTITLQNDQRYFVAWATIDNENQKNYIYIINEQDYSDLFFCEIDESKALIIINDKEMFEKLLSKMTKEVNKFYD